MTAQSNTTPATDQQAELASLLERHKQELAGKDKELAKLRRTLETRLVDAEATSAIAEAGGAPALLLPLVQQNVRLVEFGGEYVAVAVNAKGEPRANGRGGYLTVADLVAEMRATPDLMRAFDVSGSGQQSKHRTMSRAAFQALHPKERAARMADDWTLRD